MPDDICKASFVLSGSGTCGFNSVCRLTTDRRPICECPKGHTLIDLNDQYGSCKPNYTQSCVDDDELGSSEDLYDFEEITDTDWPTSDYQLLTPFIEEECRQSYLHDCMCAVAIFRSGDMCWKKKLPLSNGRFDANLNGKALIKIRKGNLPPTSPNFPRPNVKNNQKKDQENLIILGSVLLGGFVFFQFLVGWSSLSLLFLCLQQEKQSSSFS